MIIDNNDREVVSSDGQKPLAVFEISADDTAHLMTILRDTLYADKIMAVLREYGANAGDAQRDPRSSDPTRPIRVKVPTVADPTLEIQDFGPGLTPDEMTRVFIRYGASTKRGSNNAVGYIGIGGKSGFAYTDMFGIVSRTEGRCRTYTAVLDASERGELRLLDDSPCDPSETGVTIQIAVKISDVAEFTEKARAAFRYYRPRPEINIDLPPAVAESTLGSGAVTLGEWGSSWVVVMGGIPYPVDLSQLELPMQFSRVGGTVFSPIGELRVAASREALKYDDGTKAALKARLIGAMDAHVKGIIDSVSGLSVWEKRLRLAGMELFAPFIPDEASKSGKWNLFTKEITVKPEAAPVPLRLYFKSITVHANTRIVIVDDKRAIRGYALGPLDLVVRRASSTTMVETKSGVAALMEAVGVQGIPIVATSALPWVKPEHGARGSRSKVCTFEFLPTSYDEQKEKKGAKRIAKSSLWIEVDREPQEDDVYVVVDRFDNNEFFKTWKDDRVIAHRFGIDMPRIYGYKKSMGGEHPGQTYAEWSKNDLYDLIVAKFPTVDQIVSLSQYEPFHWMDDRSLPLFNALPVDHPARIVANHVSALSTYKRAFTWQRINSIDILVFRMKRDGGDGAKERGTPPPVRELYQKYPLTVGRIDDMLNKPKNWLNYFAAMDAATMNAVTTTSLENNHVDAA